MHESVLLDETIEFLRPQEGGTFVDCTFGRGGHTRRILEDLGKGGRVIAIDRDPSAIESGRETLNDTRLELVHARFSNLEQVLEARQLRERVDGILMDLGVSSPQLDDAARGFSFRAAGPLDMRMDPSSGVSAAEWLAGASEREMRECFWELGEERFGRRIARKIAEVRATTTIATTLDLVNVIRAAVPGSNTKIHPATRTFQALRLQINGELEELSTALDAACASIRVGGRVVVIAFHSLEDRIVKRRFRDLGRPQDTYGQAPSAVQFGVVTRKPVRPGDAEIERNPRSRSARLRVLERVQ
ncbi:MAG: 16S rRNA (cytosine(1402)-N(4))-methyltransferase RsmH [Gammaproteobacteria bacterium]